MKRFLHMSLASLMVLAGPSLAQTVGSIDNFDCFNDTGQTAEGFEIEIEDYVDPVSGVVTPISPSDISRAFPSNFAPSLEYVQRFGIPTIAAFDDTASGGKKGVRVTWAATWNGTTWKSKFGDFVTPTGIVAGNGVKYVAKPTVTNGDSCWALGQGINYISSGCDHFGLSFAAAKPLGKTSYHWKIPDPANPGTLINAPNAATPPISPMPALVYVPPAVPAALPVVHAVAQAPEKPDPLDPQWGTAVWVKTYTSFAKAPVNLDDLQANKVQRKPAKGTKLYIRWALLQRAPAGAVAEKEDVEDDGIPAGMMGQVKRYEYYHYTGVYDPETHEAICAPELPKSNGPCTSGPRNYTYLDPFTGLSRKIVEKGSYFGAHMEAVNVPGL